MSESLGGLVTFAIIVAVILAWFTHIVTCLMDGLWGFLIAGAIFFPVGIVHGFLIWIGAA